MCGIAGFMGPWSPDDLARMTKVLTHRGPDEEGTFFDAEGRIGIGQRRLSIIDLAGGTQPLYNESRTVVVQYNGEIYNHEELREELEAKGHKLTTKSDGEVIAHLYEEHGIDLVERLRGMFAIALWDSERKKLFLIRDRFGIKPLYYKEVPEGVLFASEAKAILAAEEGRRPDIDHQGLAWFLSFRYVTEDRTLFGGIRKLLPAHWMEIENGRTRTRRYWDLRKVEKIEGRSEKEWVDELRSQLDAAVRMRLMSDVPLGSFLSGGLDSSFIVGLMAEAMDQPVDTFSFGVGEGWHNESEHAAVVARHFATRHHELAGDCNELELLERVIWHLDEPLADTAILPTYKLSELTRKHVTVALTGEGSDELLGGYDKYKILAKGDRIGRMVPGVLAECRRRARGRRAPGLQPQGQTCCRLSG